MRFIVPGTFRPQELLHVDPSIAVLGAALDLDVAEWA
jgi:hypothetical protein